MTDGKTIDVAALIESQKANWFRVSIVIWACAVMLLEGYDIQVLAYAAPSIIKALGLDPNDLEAVRREQIAPLPFLFSGQVDNSVSPF